MRPSVTCFALLLAAPLVAASGSAANFIVNSTVDAVDASPGDGVCADVDGACTLRAAVMETNALAGADVIRLPAGTYRLAIPGLGEDAGATGDLDITDDLHLLGTGRDSTIVDGAGLDTVFQVHGHQVRIEGLTISGGDTGDPYAGGGVSASSSSLQLINVRITGNSGPGAGGIYSEASTLLLRDSEVTGNHGVVPGSSSPGSAGGIYQNHGALRVERSLVAGNEGSVAGGILSASFEQSKEYVICVDAPITVVNSTISGNRSIGSVLSYISVAGIFRMCGGPMLLINSTVTMNEAEGANSIIEAGGIGGLLLSSVPPVLQNSIVANQASGADCSFLWSLLAGWASVVSNGYNLDSDGTCGLTAATDLPSTDPMLGSLHDNGGPTQTQAPLPGSPAIDAIPVADCTWDNDGDAATPEVPVGVDQRKVPRPELAACDIGAVEVTQCGDGVDNDSDSLVDLDDPGCLDATSRTESPQCQDGINNDPGQDQLIDFDGGLSALGYVKTAPDPQCAGRPWWNREATPTGCGLGFELALVVPGLMWLRRCRRIRVRSRV